MQTIEIEDSILRIGGEGGEGGGATGEVITQASARAALNVFTFRTYPAEIKGGLAMFQLRLGSRDILSKGNAVDVLLAFDQEAYDTYYKDLRDTGVLLYDPAQCTPPEGCRHKCIQLPIDQIAKKEIKNPRSKNIVAIGALAEIYSLPKEIVKTGVENKFKKYGATTLETYLGAFQMGIDYAKQNIPIKYSFHGREKPNYNEIIISGGEAIALGAIAAGCRYCAGYPITPATPVLQFLTLELPKFGGTAVQAEDEISALASCIGASFAGAKAMTPTSGPGLSLMSELINLASMVELPVVVVDVQRAGPSTGMPTKNEQSDLRFAMYGTSGESPRIVIAPTSLEDCFYQTVRAFNLAETYQMPVIVLSDQSMAYSTQNIREPDPSSLKIVNRIRFDTKDTENGYFRYLMTQSGVSPIAIPGDVDGYHIATGLEHDEEGAPNYTPLNHEQMMAKRFKKLEAVEADLSHNSQGEISFPEGAKIGIIGWGSTEGAIKEAIYEAGKEGVKVAHYHPRVLAPLCESRMSRFVSSVDKIIIPEENFTGQFAHIVKGQFGIKPIEMHKSQGIPFSPEEVYEKIMEVA